VRAASEVAPGETLHARVAEGDFTVRVTPPADDGAVGGPA
jgi:hypothetical protein